MARARKGTVAVVTDSTAYLPAGYAQRLGVQVVPLQVIVGGIVRAEGEEIGPSEVAAVLHRGHVVSTSRPSPSLFAAAYHRAFAGGATSIVSVQLSGAMSGTVDAARLAATDVGGDITVIDSRSVGMGMGFAVIAAAEAAAAGADTATVVETVRSTLANTEAIFYVDTLEFLRRGGRIGPARALVGNALGVKPLLCLRDGRIEPLERVRTSTRAIARLEELAVTMAGDDPVSIAVHHLDAQARANQVAVALDDLLPKVNDIVMTEVGAVVGAHAGPGMLAVVVCKR
ncbi:MAG TPA: DegV family protein [Acidothermaceae bacterium]|jgi:DegV family protein with EDD domain|nr:DegV family protein [Acidothermaceae bacterium]